MSGEERGSQGRGGRTTARGGLVWMLAPQEIIIDQSGIKDDKWGQIVTVINIKIWTALSNLLFYFINLFSICTIIYLYTILQNSRPTGSYNIFSKIIIMITLNKVK